MSHPHTAALRFDYPSAADATLVARSIGVEAGQLDDDRSTVDVAQRGPTVDVEVAAADPVALRAGLNSWLRYVSVAEAVAGCEAERGP
ncbi:MAG: KEOPS complex subunit Pcc1 [Halohasta sp.]